MALSYLLGLHTFFNASQALNLTTEVAFGVAMLGRTLGLLVNTVTNAIAAAIGWAMGAALPKARTA